MKAWKLHGVGDIRYEEAAIPDLNKDEVLVQVKAAGICGSDIPRIYQTGAHVHPLIPGHEYSGVVTKLGEAADERWLGKRVGVFPLIPCGKCKPCLQKKYEMCRNYSYLGSRRDGGFAEYVSVPEWNLLELPANVSFEQAAMLEPMSVAVHAMRRLKASKQSRAAICGLGTIGLLLLMFLKECGMKDILVIGNKELQKSKAVELGIAEDCYFDERTGHVDEWLGKKANEREIDVFLECVGRNETVELAIKHTAPGGNVIFVGNPYSDMTLERQDYWMILRNQLTITGTWNSSYCHDKEDDWHYVLDCLQKGCVKPEKFITHKFNLDRLSTGLELMRDKSEEYVKIMGVND